MPTETRLAKADRLVREGRVEVLVYVNENLWTALVDGDHGAYLVTKNPEVEDCECESFQNRHHCAHIEAAEAAVLFREGANA